MSLRRHHKTTHWRGDGNALLQPNFEISVMTVTGQGGYRSPNEILDR